MELDRDEEGRRFKAGRGERGVGVCGMKGVKGSFCIRYCTDVIHKENFSKDIFLFSSMN